MNFVTFLKNSRKISKGVLSEEIPIHSYIPIDLSSKNQDLLASSAYETPQQFEAYITAYLKKHNGLVAYGGYAEIRDLYKSSRLFEEDRSEVGRNIHLGIDFWCPAGTSVTTPLDGIVHSFANNTAIGDYGPTVIIQHIIEGITFYTLYGHLCTDTIAALKVGEKFLAGESLGKLGDFEVNGGYAPHLHFQLIKDLEGYRGDYPGVSAKKNLDSFLKNCPDPLHLLDILRI